VYSIENNQAVRWQAPKKSLRFVGHPAGAGQFAVKIFCRWKALTEQGLADSPYPGKSENGTSPKGFGYFQLPESPVLHAGDFYFGADMLPHGKNHRAAAGPLWSLKGAGRINHG